MRTIIIKETEDPKDIIEYWRNKTPEERLTVVETLREQYYVIQGFTSIPRITRVINLTNG